MYSQPSTTLLSCQKAWLPKRRPCACFQPTGPQAHLDNMEENRETEWLTEPKGMKWQAAGLDFSIGTLLGKLLSQSFCELLWNNLIVVCIQSGLGFSVFIYIHTHTRVCTHNQELTTKSNDSNWKTLCLFVFELPKLTHFMKFYPRARSLWYKLGDSYQTGSWGARSYYFCSPPSGDRS